MNFKEDESADKLRGGYYTPEPIAKFLVRWAVHKKPASILEPSCGDGSFIRAFESIDNYPARFTGVELIEEEAVKARESAELNEFLEASIINNDFLEWFLEKINDGNSFEAVLGNPPYIRYQYLDEKDQKFSELIFRRNKLSFTKHTNAWVPFVIASLDLLAPGGRLAMVIPSELLHVLHANSLRAYLLKECSRILLIDPNELLFKDALQGTVLLMAEKKLNANDLSKGVAIVSAPNNNFLESDPEKIFIDASYVSGDLLNGKWMKVFLEPKELEVFERVRSLPMIKKFSEIASVDVGIVTGANKFFLVNNHTVENYNLQVFSKPMFGRSEHCKGIIYSEQVHIDNSIRGLATNFIQFDKVNYDDLPHGAREYISFGESQGLHTRYKCRIRTPWYSVPSVYTTELGMLKRSHNYPRLILNQAGAFTTDTAYRIRSSVNNKSFVYCFINSLTALTAELEGRHYGGGVLELVPSEIERLLIPIVEVDESLLEELDEEIRNPHDPDVLFMKQDLKVLTAAGLSKEERLVIHEAWLHIRMRRHRILNEEIKIKEEID